MTSTIIVPLNKLDADPKNVRKTYNREGVEALAASIRAGGYRLIQDPVVRKGDKRGRYFVIAGGRRRAALDLLAEAGEIAKDFPVECKLREAEDATEISLAENVMREAMRPAEQFEAFKSLADEGRSVKEIAARFGTTEIIVNRRLALARLSPALFELYRRDEMTFDQLAAFTISDDHARQEQVWNDLPDYSRHASTIKRMLAAEEVPAGDKRIKFIGGLDTVEAAGGAIRRDLFDGDNGGYATDSGLVDRLVLQKLEAEVETVKAEGWKWVEVHASQPEGIYSMGRVYPQTIALSDEDQQRLDQLKEDYDSLAELIEAGAEDEADEDRLAEIEEQMTALNKREEAYRDDDLARAGAIVTLDYHGRSTVHRGLVKGEDDIEKAEGGESGSDDDGESSQPKAAKLTHSATLIEDLTAQKTAALRVELASNPDIALAAVVHALLLNTAYSYARDHSALQIGLTHERVETSMKQPEASKAALAFDDLRERWGDQTPGNPADLWDWCLDQPRDQLLSLLAFSAAHSLNAVETKFHGRKDALAHADALGCALNVDMREWFTTTSDSYFKHLNRQSIELAVAEARGADFAQGIANMKKAEAAAYAERQVEGTGWLPAPVRIAAQSDEANELPEAAE